MDHGVGSGLDARAAVALDVVRWTVAGLIWIHGAARLSAGGVEPFGGWLEGQGFPFGLQQAWAVTIYELVAPLFIIAGRFVTIACLGHIFILCIGLVLVHAPNGWFVVGLGRNGVEYSVILIACLIAVGWTYLPQMFGGRP
jgi:putative oxidoreductase